MNVFVFAPDAADAVLDPEKPVTGRALHMPVEVGLSDGAWVEVHPAGQSQLDVPLSDGTLVVTEGGENLQPPVQPGVQARLNAAGGAAAAAPKPQAPDAAAGKSQAPNDKSQTNPNDQ